MLLDLVNRCYVNPDDSLLANNGADGGRDHPRHERVWKKVTVCYIEMCDVIPEVSLSCVPRSYDVQFQAIDERPDGRNQGRCCSMPRNRISSPSHAECF